MPPVQFTSPETHGVALYYLPPPGQPHNWLAEFTHRYTANTSRRAEQTYLAWLQSQAAGSGIADLEKQITDRMKARQDAINQARRISAQERTDYVKFLGIVHSGRMAALQNEQRVEGDIAVAREQTRRARIEGGNLTDTDAHRAFVHGARARVGAIANDLRDAVRAGSPEERDARLDQVEQAMHMEVVRTGLAAANQFNDLQLDEFARDLMRHGHSILTERGPEGIQPADPLASRILLEGISQIAAVRAKQPEERFGARSVDPAAALNASAAETRNLLGLKPGAAFPASGGRSIGVGTSGRVPADGDASIISPDDLDLSALRNQMLNERARQQRQLEELLVRQTAPGVIRRRDRQIERALREAGLPEVSGQRALDVYRTLNPNPQIAADLAPFGGGEAPADPIAELGDRNQGAETRELGGGPLPQGTMLPSGAPDPSAAPARPPRVEPEARDEPASAFSRMGGDPYAKLSLEEARKLDGEVPAQQEIDALLEQADQNPEAIQPDTWEQLIDWQMTRIAIDEALQEDDVAQPRVEPGQVSPSGRVSTQKAPTGFTPPPRQSGVEQFEASVNDPETGNDVMDLTISPEATDAERANLLQHFERLQRFREEPVLPAEAQPPTMQFTPPDPATMGGQSAVDEQEELLRLIEEERKRRAAAAPR